jgi:hypothetical protein
MGLRCETEVTWASECFGWRNYALQVLALVLWSAGIAKAADFRMFPQNSKKRRGSAPVKTAKEDEIVVLNLGHGKPLLTREFETYLTYQHDRRDILGGCLCVVNPWTLATLLDTPFSFIATVGRAVTKELSRTD